MTNMVIDWINTLKSANKTCLIQDGKYKVHYVFANKDEMTEEYSVDTYQLMVRKWRRKSTGLTRVESWEYEVGESLSPTMALPNETLRENINNPVFLRLDKKEHFQWRIRNLPYSFDTYAITVEDDQKHIAVRTSNKKYFKKFSIPDIERFGLNLNKESLTFDHTNNTLVISYKKPEVILNLERMVKAELRKVKDDGEKSDIPAQICCLS